MCKNKLKKYNVMIHTPTLKIGMKCYCKGAIKNEYQFNNYAFNNLGLVVVMYVVGSRSGNLDNIKAKHYRRRTVRRRKIRKQKRNQSKTIKVFYLIPGLGAMVRIYKVRGDNTRSKPVARQKFTLWFQLKIITQWLYPRRAEAKQLLFSTLTLNTALPAEVFFRD